MWIYVKNTDTVKREFYRASLACLVIHILLKDQKYMNREDVFMHIFSQIQLDSYNLVSNEFFLSCKK